MIKVYLWIFCLQWHLLHCYSVGLSDFFIVLFDHTVFGGTLQICKLYLSSAPDPGFRICHCLKSRYCGDIWDQALTSTRYPTRPELLFCYPNPTRTTFKKFRVSGFSQQAVSQQAASNLLTIILKFCCFLVALTRNPLFN